ncbi:helix-turn-helix domain-containing protein [Streptosporangium sp. KLBMP 9127]|nr:helix-turn-helix domain-containing protein [Streptosporangium sp. KLBMP 9127]
MKERSGQSYADLARRTYISSSTLHRYCTGKARPPDVGVVTRIARVCGATEPELRDLARAWAFDEGIRAAGPLPASPTAPLPALVIPNTDPAETATAVPGVGSARSKRRTLTGVLIASLIISFGTVSSQGPFGTAPRPASPQWVSGPSWVVAPRPVQPARFGVTMNTNTGEMPSFRVGSVRFWDSQTRWANLEPRRGEYDWSVLDRLVNGAQRAGLPALFVIGGTPAWAALKAPRMAYPEGARAAPPDDLANWRRFVRALAGRYRGRMEAYELWPVANDSRFYNGDTATLVEMTRQANQIIKQADPGAIVVCPGVGRLWNSEGQGFLRQFAEAGGYGHCDVASVKLHQRSASDPPETMLAILDAAYRTMHQAGVHPPIWSTGTTHDIVLQRPLDEERAIDHATRFYLTGLYGSVNVNLSRTYFYAWGARTLPLTLQVPGAAPTRAALAVEQLQRWLTRSRIRACGQGTAIQLPANVWQCEFSIPDVDGRYRPAVLRWTHAGTASTSVPPHTTRLLRLDGTATPVRPGDFAEISTRPILLTAD